MKKLFFLTFMLLMSIFSNAQLKVDSNGRVGISTNPSNEYVLQISALNSQGASILREGSPQGFTQYGLSVLSNAYTGTFSYGLYAKVQPTSQSSIVHTGVYGMGSGSPVQNYGIYGRISANNKGAAVCGSTINSDYVLADSCYAGYFQGLTHVQGNLSVSGTINGLLLGRSSSDRSFLSAGNNAKESITRRLRGLTINQFLIETSSSSGEQEITEKLREIDSTHINEIAWKNTDLTLSYIEKQVITKQHFGLDADQLEEVFPDLVYEQEDGTKGINYVEMVPILVQAINELKGEIEELRTGSDEGAKKAVQTTSEGDSAEKLLLLSLGQNKPNPFSNVTTIEVCIPEDVQKAFIYVYDLQGKKVEQMDITARGKQNIQFTSANLTDGMYLYSLIADGKVIETRRMIVEK